MGGRRLHREKALAAASALILPLLLIACDRGGKAQGAAATPPTASASTVVMTPTPSPTPDLLGPAPRDDREAAARLTQFLYARPGGACGPEGELARAWHAVCATGDLDGDGQPDAAILIPLPAGQGPSPNPGVVFVRRGAGPLERFPADAEADASIVGRAIFAVTDRAGQPRPQVVLLANSCGAHTCSSRVFIESWDGTAWRDLGPGEAIDSLDRITFDGAGTRGALVMHGGIIQSVGAGPPRAETVTYTFENGRWGAKAVEPDPPVYLFHAIRDADGLFDLGKFAGAATAYRAAVDNPDLKDWRMETVGQPGRDSLAAYALLRIAVATAARGEDPTSAVDAAIRDSKEPLFVNAAEAFRRGFQEGNGVHGGCVEVTRYLATPGVPELVRQIFDYGYANYPVKSYRDVCPL